MSRRRVRPPAGNDFPAPLDVFAPGDWWMKDPEDPAELQYARLQWTAARRVYREGGDWDAFLGPPVWWLESPRPVPGDAVCTDPISQDPSGPSFPQGPHRVPVVHRARPIKLH